MSPTRYWNHCFYLVVEKGGVLPHPECREILVHGLKQESDSSLDTQTKLEYENQDIFIREIKTKTKQKKLSGR